MPEKFQVSPVLKVTEPPQGPKPVGGSARAPACPRDATRSCQEVEPLRSHTPPGRPGRRSRRFDPPT